MMQNFEVYISYGQLAVFGADLKNPFNDWTEQHVLQGFAWREESVSFATMHDAGTYKVELEMVAHFQMDVGVKRAISVPFEVKANQLLEIASISDGQTVQLKPAHYQLIFQEWSKKNKKCRLSFVENGATSPSVLVKDKALQPIYPLLMTAQPA